MYHQTAPADVGLTAATLLGVLICCAATVAEQPPDVDVDVEDDTFIEVEVFALQENHLNVGDVLGHVLDELGMDGSLFSSAVDARVDVTTNSARLTFLALELASDDGLRFQTADDQFKVTIDRLRLRRRAHFVKRQVRRVVELSYPQAAAAVGEGVGTHVRLPDAPPELPTRQNVSGRAVLLVHGIDSRPTIWRALEGRLYDTGHRVITFRYPNDQPIEDSSRLLAEHLAHLRTLGARRLSIVAHSMGGLVARQLLTDPQHYGGRGRAHDRFPDVERLIMVATPNHGSKLSRLSVAGEWGEHFQRRFSGEGLIFSVLDGLGEARVDLQPDSIFLRRLNARPLPTDVQTTIIAGRSSPVPSAKIDDLRRHWRQDAPEGLRSSLEAVAAVLTSVVDGEGDGAVSVASARLSGVEDFVVLPGNHTSLIWAPSGSDEVPPAIPVIVERLGRSGEDHASERRQ